MREQRNLKAKLQQCNSKIQAKCAEVTAGRDPGAARNHAKDEGQKCV